MLPSHFHIAYFYGRGPHAADLRMAGGRSGWACLCRLAWLSSVYRDVGPVSVSGRALCGELVGHSLRGEVPVGAQHGVSPGGVIHIVVSRLRPFRCSVRSGFGRGLPTGAGWLRGCRPWVSHRWPCPAWRVLSHVGTTRRVEGGFTGGPKHNVA